MEENIVKKTCKELNITQKELSEILDIPQSIVSGWATTNIPKMAELSLNLLVENKQLKEKLDVFKKAFVESLVNYKV